MLINGVKWGKMATKWGQSVANFGQNGGKKGAKKTGSKVGKMEKLLPFCGQNKGKMEKNVGKIEQNEC